MPEAKTYTMKMVISLSGILERAAMKCQKSRDMKHLAFSLRELNRHLEMVRADPARVNEFFELYVKD